MYLLRVAFFRLRESPRFLVTAGRPEEALRALTPAEQDRLIALLERGTALLPAAGPPQLD